jgi:alcohol dehydrogenase, propanol-preferring
MLAVQLRRWSSEPELVEVPTPAPAPGGVLLKVEAAGLCHSDLHMMRWPAGTLPYQLPFTLGHETAGTVVALGEGTTGVSVGDRVVVYSRWGCGTCWHCLQGMENFCVRSPDGAHGAGVGRDGGLAEFMIVPSVRHLVQIADLDPAAAAPLTDAALTPYHAIKGSSHQLRPGTTTVVIGVGGLGYMAIQILRAISPVRIVAVDLRAEALQLASSAGAHETLSSRGLEAGDLRAAAGRDGATLVVDCVGADATLDLAAGAVAQGGDILYVGRAGGSLAVAPGRLPYCDNEGAR